MKKSLKDVVVTNIQDTIQVENHDHIIVDIYLIFGLIACIVLAITITFCINSLKNTITRDQTINLQTRQVYRRNQKTEIPLSGKVRIRQKC